MRTLAVILSLAIAGCVSPTRVITATHWPVVRVIDGDTFVVHYDGEDTSVRIVGIDTPERRQDGFQEATDDLKRLIAGKTVVLVFSQKHKRDNFGRLLADVEVDGVDVASSMLKSGLAEYR